MIGTGRLGSSVRSRMIKLDKALLRGNIPLIWASVSFFWIWKRCDGFYIPSRGLTEKGVGDGFQVYCPNRHARGGAKMGGVLVYYPIRIAILYYTCTSSQGALI